MKVKAEAYKKYGDAALVSMVLEVLPHLAGEVRALITTKVFNVKNDSARWPAFAQFSV